MSAEHLFIPLKAEYYEAFERREKTEEFRPLNKLWNAEKCRIGRPVVLSYGYGKARRLRGKVVSFRVHPNPSELPGWTACYGDKHGSAACIGIALDN